MPNCCRCHKDKPKNAFYSHWQRGLQTICKECHAEDNKRWYRKNPEKRAEIMRRCRMKARYRGYLKRNHADKVAPDS